MARTSGQAFATSYVELQKVKSLRLGLLNPDEVAKMSVAKIMNDRIYDEHGHPNFQAINDPRMGTMDKELKCRICKGTQSDCPGHFGHIELAMPVYHAGLIEYVRKVLRIVCFNCQKILEGPEEKDKLKRDEIMRIRKGRDRFNKVLKYSENIKVCPNCQYKQPKFVKSGLRIIAEYQEDMGDQSKDKKQALAPEQALKVLERIQDEDLIIMGFDPSNTKPQYCIIKNLAVAPPPVRPSVAMTSSMRSEDDLTYAYQKIIQFNNLLQNAIDKGGNSTQLNELRTNLQYYVATLMDNEIQGQPTQKHKSGKPLKAIRARLRGKEGRLRGNLMGKRVDFSARTVITPDPNLKLDQLGVPEHIATNLTVPETVTYENLNEMRVLVYNGPNKWPGAKYIIRHDDKQIDLGALKNRSDAHLEPGYKVERHLKNDDYVIFNRQPSLHKMSLMGHRVKVLPFYTFRLNLSVTTPYNADFDGDEMNMHVPQSFETMAEIKEIMAVPRQIVSPQSNKPVMGIVQDSLLGVMLFTLKDCFVELDLVMNLLMWIEYSGTIPAPVIIKPKPLWTGKQLFSLIVPNVNIKKFGEKNKNNWASAGDKNILIQNGQLHCGIMTKGTIGNSAGGLVHTIWKEQGPEATKDFLSNTQLLINNWLYNNGFTVGVQDIIAKTETIQSIQKKLTLYKHKMKKIEQKAQMGKLQSQPGKSMIESFEAKVNQTLNKARDESGNLALEDLATYNRLKAMVFAGSKGSNLNISQIMACVGQQNVEGKRIPFGFNKRSLPHFSKDDFGPESKGFVENCYLNGLTPSEFFFHAMGGREGLIDTAVKTAETGYIQRRLIKAMEDVMVKYDGTVRTSREQIIQFLYGEDGLAGEHIEDLGIDLLKMDNDTVEQKHRFLPAKVNEREAQIALSKSMEEENVKFVLNDTSLILKLEEEYKQILRDRSDLRYDIFRNCEDKIHIGVNVPRLLWNSKEKFGVSQYGLSDLRPDYVLQEMQALFESLCVIPGVQVRQDPLILEAHRNSTWLFQIYLRQMLSTKQVIQSERMTKQAFDWLLGEIRAKFEAAIVNPGEMIGSIGAQSMGEPATQMTLNTFHNAGISSKNVTLGVPRLKEIINVAKNIKTPSMKIFLEKKPHNKAKYATAEKHSSIRAHKFGMKIEHTTLADLVKSSAIYYDPDPLNTVVSDDLELVRLYLEIPQPDLNISVVNPWLLRFELDSEKMNQKDLLIGQLEKKIYDAFQEQVNIMHSDDNAAHLVLRIRIKDIEDDEEETVCMYMKEFETKLIHELTLKGIPEISKVTFSKYMDNDFDEQTGKHKVVKDCYMIETDGVALQKILSYPKVDFKKTISNDIIEILKVLGIEAVRQTLVNELRFVLGAYGIYVNYRHLATLCDVMTQRGVLTSITRHGINRVDTGPLRKCSFEETVEILLEAAVFSEVDPLKGITENLIMGQLAPFGTGCFDLHIDSEILEKFAFSHNFRDSSRQGSTPYLYEEPRDINLNDMPYLATPHLYTPKVGMTDYYDPAPGSVYSDRTPQYMDSFSPHPQMQSPMYQMSPNPTMSPGISPAYQTQTNAYRMQSPIYQAVDYSSAMGQPSNMPQPSPIYSPTQQQQSSYASGIASSGAGYSPTQNLQSPIYSGSINQHNYSPSQNQNQSYSYSPTGVHQSPAYSPTMQAYGTSQSPYYSPQSPAYGSSNRYQSPRYQSISGMRGQVAGSPMSAQPYVPSSPAYNLTSPAYDASLAAYQPTQPGQQNNNNNAAGNQDSS